MSALDAAALSQYPSPNGELPDDDCAEIALLGGSELKAIICHPILWEDIVTKTAADPVLCLLSSKIKQGFPTKFYYLNKDLSPYWNIRNSLDVEGEVVWYNGRIVVPASLPSRALDVPHSARQGITSMENRAREIVSLLARNDEY